MESKLCSHGMVIERLLFPNGDTHGEEQSRCGVSSLDLSGSLQLDSLS